MVPLSVVNWYSINDIDTPLTVAENVKLSAGFMIPENEASIVTFTTLEFGSSDPIEE